MRDAARELADGLHLLGLEELHLRFAKRFGGLVQPGPVEDHGQQFASTLVEPHATDQHRHTRAVGTRQLRLHRGGRCPVCGGRVVERAGAEVRDADEPRVEFRLRASGEPQELRIGQGDDAGRVRDHERHRARGEERTQSLLHPGARAALLDRPDRVAEFRRDAAQERHGLGVECSRVRREERERAANLPTHTDGARAARARPREAEVLRDVRIEPRIVQVADLDRPARANRQGRRPAVAGLRPRVGRHRLRPQRRFAGDRTQVQRAVVAEQRHVRHSEPAGFQREPARAVEEGALVLLVVDGGRDGIGRAEQADEPLDARLGGTPVAKVAHHHDPVDGAIEAHLSQAHLHGDPRAVGAAVLALVRHPPVRRERGGDPRVAGPRFRGRDRIEDAPADEASGDPVKVSGAAVHLADHAVRRQPAHRLVGLVEQDREPLALPHHARLVRAALAPHERERECRQRREEQTRRHRPGTQVALVALEGVPGPHLEHQCPMLAREVEDVREGGLAAVIEPARETRGGTVEPADSRAVAGRR